jgi:hypothetical protein
MKHVWWAVPGSSIDEVFELVLAPDGYVRDPRWVHKYDLDDIRLGCIALGEWTIVLARKALFDDAFATFPGARDDR